MRVAELSEVLQPTGRAAKTPYAQHDDNEVVGEDKSDLERRKSCGGKSIRG